MQHGPSHRLTPVDQDMDGNDIFIPGQQYRIHTKKQSYDNDKLGIFVGRDVHGSPMFKNVNMRDPESGKRYKQEQDDKPISFPSTLHLFYKSGKAIAAAKVLESHGVPPFINGYGGSRRKRRRIRTVKRR